MRISCTIRCGQRDKGEHMKIIILAGGGGTRLFPLSRKCMPKQFLSIDGDTSLLGETIARFRQIIRPEDIVIVTNEISSDGIEYDGDTKMYISLLGRINSALSKRADKVYEVVYGIPIEIKRGQ